ncbi:adaptor protein MecA [Fructilactobacillus vespulae]|uniref:adaptor protein MecA n=1 Tax=Fructilactobacillus vespulae TaxID=1249630 RepID=UPI0039B433BC
MKYERTDENTIKVWITQADLKERNINPIEFMNDRDKVERFFYSILEEVDEKRDFQDNDLVSFQILPQKDGIQMVISKDSNIVSKLTEEDLNFMSDETKERFKQKQAQNKPIDYFDEEKLYRVVPVYFASFEDLIGGVNEIKHDLELPGINIYSSLFKDRDVYYLLLEYFLIPNGIVNDEKNEIKLKLDLIDNQLALMYEYGQLSPISDSEIKQHTKEIMDSSAINKLAKYFN